MMCGDRLNIRRFVVTLQTGRNERLIKWPVLKIMVPYTRQHILRLEKQGKFPKRIKIGDRSVAWDYWEIVTWIEKLKSARTQPMGSDSISGRTLPLLIGGGHGYD